MKTKCVFPVHGLCWDTRGAQSVYIWRFGWECDSITLKFVHILREGVWKERMENIIASVTTSTESIPPNTVDKSGREEGKIKHHFLHQNHLPLPVRSACGNVPFSGKLPPLTTKNQQKPEAATRCLRFRWVSCVKRRSTLINNGPTECKRHQCKPKVKEISGHPRKT